MQDAVLAMLAKEPSHGYELRARLRASLGPLGDGMNPGQIYVTLGRLEKGGLIVCNPIADNDRKIYELTPAGQQRVTTWLGEVGAKLDLPEFHLKLVVAAAARLADPVQLVGAQRRELLRSLREAQHAVLTEPAGSTAAVLLEGVVLRLQADLRWLDVCERAWSNESEDV